jgi:hypothetical protein
MNANTYGKIACYMNSVKALVHNLALHASIKDQCAVLLHRLLESAITGQKLFYNVPVLVGTMF